uniref:Reverse transcriptase zinc-binding domain-containing protein n=1 Tax=Fagus sylvatica TaxID=28930 RepID=A0A2N9J2S6_FAGSY
MTQSHPKLIQGSWRVGKGLTIPINHPAWFSPHPNAPQHLLSQISTFGNLIDQHNACWRTQLITQLYDKRDSDLILSIPIPLIHSNATSDQLIWPYSITGEYQVKKAYDIIIHTESSLNPTTPANPNLWKRLWKIKLPLKILTFTWKLLHHAILVRSELNNRGIQCDRTCILCNNANETQDHLFLHCDLARAIWFGADINIRPITDTGTLVEQWLQALILMPNAASCHTTHLHMTLTLLWFLQSPTNNAGTTEMDNSTTRPNWQLQDNWQLLITTEGGVARNSRWQGIAFMGKTKDSHITLVGCKSTIA